VIGLRRPEDYSLEQGARFEVHVEKLRNRVDEDAAIPFEARLEAISSDDTDAVRWWDCEMRPPILKKATARTCRRPSRCE
jgi:putative DNA primase/helicase